MKQFNFILLNLFITVSLQAQIITVKQDGSGDFVKIQDAIDHATDGDTVLVWPGIYFENLNFNKKGICLGSLCLTTGDEAYINQTIIDANDQDRCIYAYDIDYPIEINGFTLQNGNTINNSYPYDGGGIRVREAKAIIANCIIQNNFARAYGGGILCYEAEVFLSNTTIKNNHSLNRGGGICMLLGEVLYDSIKRCNIFLNYGAKGMDIAKIAGPVTTVYVDTFTVINPDSHFAYSYNSNEIPINDILLDIVHAKVQEVNSNLYVSNLGSNQNDGTSPGSPLKTIGFALLKTKPDTNDPKTIFIEDGEYSRETGEKFPLNLRSYVSIVGASKDSTILDGSDFSSLMQANVLIKGYTVKNLTLRNANTHKMSLSGALYVYKFNTARFENLKLCNNKGLYRNAFSIAKPKNVYFSNVEVLDNIGSVSMCATLPDSNSYYSADTVWFENCRFNNNRPDYDTIDIGAGGGLAISGLESAIDSLTAYVTNCEFSDNYVREVSGGMSSSSLTTLSGAKTFLINSTIGNNFSENQYGGSVGVVLNSELNVYNSIIYANDPAQFFMKNDAGGQSDLNIYNSLVEDGIFGIKVYSPGNLVHYDPTNIDADPLWANDGWYPYMLMPGSPCINTGTLDLPSHIHLPETDLAGNPRIYDGQIDMGAYEFGPWVGLDYQKPKAKSQKLTASPNPFRNHCKIKYECKEQGQQSIFVYDLQGKRVATLMDISGQPASGQLNWNGTDDYGRKLKPGIYIIELTNNKRSLGSVKVEIVD
jgi:Protein of unknown function (DUF1565)